MGPNRWSTIAAQLPGRTDNEIKNYWNTHLKKRLLRMGLDPDSSAAPSAASAAATRHMAQWESARMEAEARLSRESLLFSSSAAGPTSSAAGAGNGPASSAAAAGGVGDVSDPEPDIFLRMWHSDVGSAFRKDVGGGGRSPETSSVKREEVESKSCVSSSNEVEDEFQMYLNFAGDELGFFHGQLGGFSLFSNDLHEASLDSALK